MQRVYQRPRAAFLGDANYQQGASGAITAANMNVGGGYGNPVRGDFRLIAFYTSGTHTAPSSTPYHRRGYFPIYTTAGGGTGWYVWGAHSWEQNGSIVDPFPGVGTTEIMASWVIALKNVDPVQPLYPAGHPHAPAVTTSGSNTLSYGVPGYTDLYDEHLLLHINVAYFANANCVTVGQPDNPPMLRNWNYWPSPASYPSGEVNVGFAFNIDYAYVGGSSTSFASQTKAFGGSNNANHCSTFRILIRGQKPSGGYFAASNLMGGPTG